jgi:hypothetical protein
MVSIRHSTADTVHRYQRKFAGAVNHGQRFPPLNDAPSGASIDSVWAPRGTGLLGELVGKGKSALSFYMGVISHVLLLSLKPHMHC